MPAFHDFVLSEDNTVVEWSLDNKTIILKDFQKFRAKVQAEKSLRLNDKKFMLRVRKQFKCFFFSSEITKEGYLELTHPFIRKDSSM